MSKNVTTFDINMEETILSKAKAKELKGLSLKKERDKKGLFLVEGEKCVKDTLDSFNLDSLICTREWIDNNPDIKKNWGKYLKLADKRTIEIISSLNSLPDVIAVFKIPDSDNEIPVLDKDKLYVLLDEIQDPGNLGTIIRTCDWFGVYEIYASKNTVDVYSPKVVQASMGSLSRVKVHYLELEKLIIKNRELKLIGTLLEGKPLSTINFSSGMLLMGNEGRGISKPLKDLVDISLTIPPVNPHNHPDSLNVAITTAIVLSHIHGEMK